jgi:homogentisate 1,2-dioxygenase
MNQKIIYPNETGIAVITPSGELSVEETALKIVPTGVKYKIIEQKDLPEDRTFRNAWEYDFDKNGHDGVGA